MPKHFFVCYEIDLAGLEKLLEGGTLEFTDGAEAISGEKMVSGTVTGQVRLALDISVEDVRAWLHTQDKLKGNRDGN